MIAKPERLASELIKLDKNKLYELKEWKHPRNTEQNKKYWKLLYELAKVVKINIEDLHFKMLKDYSTRYQVCVPHKTKLRGIKYFEKICTKSKNGKMMDIYMIYTPSHELDTSEFAFLMNGLIQECEQQKIETRSPDEILREELI